jgi:hypothetical protein
LNRSRTLALLPLASRPADVALGGHQVQVLEVAQEPEAAGAGAVEQFGVQPVRFTRRFLRVALGEGLQEFGVGVAPLRLLVAQVVDVGFLVVGVGDLPESVGEVRLCLV